LAEPRPFALSVDAVTGTGTRIDSGTALTREETAMDFFRKLHSAHTPRRPSSRQSTRLLLLLPALGLAAVSAQAAEQATVIPAPAVEASAPTAEGLQKAVLAGGCFWGVQAVYQHTKGVTRAVSGYSGGTKETAQYEMVARGRTRHAESVEVTFDPRQISYGKILQIFFSVVHDPTQFNRQGPDIGPQYRSAIFYADDEQKRVAESYLAQLDQAKVFKRPIVTQINTLSAFYPAEDYHQDFAVRYPSHPYIVYNDAPKVENLKRIFADAFRDVPVTVMASGKAGH
jgi:peptide-methionine (S)-S-oxide reductase